MSNLVIAGNTYPDVPSIVVPKEGGGYATYSEGGGGTVELIPGVLRPDAEVCWSHSFDQHLVADVGFTWPAYSTTTVTAIPSEELVTYTTDTEFYRYAILYRALCIPEYSITTKGKGRLEYTFGSNIYEGAKINRLYAISDPSVSRSTTANTFTANTLTAFSRTMYWTSSSTTTASTSTYGVRATAVGPTHGSDGSSITIKSPNVYVQGSSTYFASTYFNAVTDVRIQWIVEIYRVRWASMNIKGFNQTSQAMHIVDCVNSASHTLT